MLNRILSPLTEFAYAMFRIAFGLLFAFHGAQKHFGLLAEGPAPAYTTQVLVGGWIELVGGLMVMLGLGTRLAAFLCSGTMAVAYVQFHWDFATDDKFFPIVNKGEMALLYAFGFLLIACRGPGKASVDGLLARRSA